MKGFFEQILDILFPKKCFGCGTGGFLICPECLKKIPEPESPQKDLLAAVSYKSETIKKAVHALKYQKSKITAEILAELLYEKLKDKITKIKEVGLPNNCVLIPVPLSKKRLKERGFNQAELLAKHLSDKLKIPLLTDVLYKTRETASQVEIRDREKRLKNLKGAFGIKNPSLIKNKIIFLVDDVSTTGATIKECRKTLLLAGAKKIIGVTVAGG